MPQGETKFLAKVFERDGSALSLNIPHGSIRGHPSFTDRINGGQGELILDYAAPFDNFGEGTRIDLQFIIDLLAFDDDHPLGRRLYRGAIQELEPYLENSQQGVRLKALGLGSNLSYDIYMASSRVDYSVVHSGDDPEDIFKAIIDEHRAYVNNPLINYGIGSTEAVGAAVDKTFTDRTWFDSIEETKAMCGSGWWWHVDADGLGSLLPKPTTPTHKFIIGKHIEKGSFPKSIKSVKNRVRVKRNGGTATEYSDPTSIGRYESRFEKLDDSSLGDESAADQAGNKKVADGKEARNKNTLIVNSTYDLESIKVGHTCSLLNGDVESSFASNSQIVGLTYDGDRVTLELEESATDLGLALEKFKRAS